MSNPGPVIQSMPKTSLQTSSHSQTSYPLCQGAATPSSGSKVGAEGVRMKMTPSLPLSQHDKGDRQGPTFLHQALSTSSLWAPPPTQPWLVGLAHKAGQPGSRGTRHRHPGASGACTESGNTARSSGGRDANKGRSRKRKHGSELPQATARENPPQRRWSWVRGRTDPNSEPKPMALVRRVSEQRKSQNCQHQQILPGLETLEEGLGDLIKEKLTHTWRARHLS